MLSIALLVAVALLLAWFLRGDLAEYEAFKLLTRTEDRQAAFRRWTIKSFFLFGGAALAVLAILGRLDALVRMPLEFAALSGPIASRFSGEGGVGTGFLIGLGIAAVAGG